MLTAAEEIYQGTAQRPPLDTGLIVVGGSLVVSPLGPEPGFGTVTASPSAPSWWNRSLVPFDGGHLVCSDLQCGATKADWVGPYALDLTCDEGTYSPIYGGTCWACPANDGLEIRETSTCWRSRRTTPD